MFGSKKNDKKNNEFGDKGYQMKDYYEADNLVVARFARVSSAFTGGSPMIEETQQKYTFEKIKDGEKVKYKEIFTGFIACDEETYFDLPYVIEPQQFTHYFPETKGIKIPKLSLIWAQNDINFSKKVPVRVPVRKKTTGNNK